MSAKNDGGPAFPSLVSVEEYSDRAQGYVTQRVPVGGMSLRDYFAGQALAGMFASGGHRDVAMEIHGEQDTALSWTEIGQAAETRIAAMAYSVADAMIEARAK